MTFLWDMYNNRPMITLALAGTTVVLVSELIYYAYTTYINLFEPAETKSQTSSVVKTQLRKVYPSKVNLTSAEEKKQAELEERKPRKLWNTVIFFPDYNPDKQGSPTNQLYHYFESARMSIHICMYLASHPGMAGIIKKKYDEGLMVQIVTDFDTYTAHNSCAVKQWRREGIEVRMKCTGFLMHHKFAIVDEEAVLTGSLNWTKQGCTCNQENVMVTTNTQIVKKYMDEFNTLWCLFADVDGN